MSRKKRQSSISTRHAHTESLVGAKERCDTDITVKSCDNDDRSSNDDINKKSMSIAGMMRELRNVPYNVKLIFIYTFFFQSGLSIWNRQILSTYIYEISNDSTKVLGYIEATQGFAYLITAPIAGILIDKIESRIKICYIASILCTLAIIAGCYVTIYDNSQEYIYYIWLAFFGVGSCFSLTITKTILSDETPKFNRDLIYSFNGFIKQFGLTLGPLITLLLFYYLGNTWDISIMNIVLLSGLGMFVVPQIILLIFKPTPPQESTNIDDKKLINDNAKDTKIDTNSCRYKAIPWLFVIHRLSLCTGAGMTVKFFPIYFEDILKLSPMALTLIYVLVPLIQALCTLIAERMSKWLNNRIIVMLIFKLSGISCLYIMAFLTQNEYIPKYNIIIIITYILRTALMNCCYPLELACLMDYTSTKNKGKWNAIESIQRTIWTLSAALGGVLLTIMGYNYVFMLTASGYLIFTIILCPLISIAK